MNLLALALGATAFLSVCVLILNFQVSNLLNRVRALENRK